jgi:hypothetical protein
LNIAGWPPTGSRVNFDDLYLAGRDKEMLLTKEDLPEFREIVNKARTQKIEQKLLILAVCFFSGCDAVF